MKTRVRKRLDDVGKRGVETDAADRSGAAVAGVGGGRQGAGGDLGRCGRRHRRHQLWRHHLLVGPGPQQSQVALLRHRRLRRLSGRRRRRGAHLQQDLRLARGPPEGRTGARRPAQEPQRALPLPPPISAPVRLCRRRPHHDGRQANLGGHPPNRMFHAVIPL